MNKEEKIKTLKEELRDSAENPTIIYPTFDGSDEEEFENDKLLTPISCKILLEYITQLENNWNELKKWLEEEINKGGSSIDLSIRIHTLQEVLNKLNELEGGNSE